VFVKYEYANSDEVASQFVNKLCGRPTQYAPPRPASWQYLPIYSPGGTCSGMLGI